MVDISMLMRVSGFGLKWEFLNVVLWQNDLLGHAHLDEFYYLSQSNIARHQKKNSISVSELLNGLNFIHHD